jgi:YVTN family beta-propeller protein
MMISMTTRRWTILTALLLTFAGASLAAEAYLHSPTGSEGLIMVDKRAAKVRFFDPKSLTEISNIEIGINPHELVISPDHTTAYITIYGDGVYAKNPNPGHQIAIIDLASRKATGFIDLSPYKAPHGIQIGQDGMLYVSCDQERKVLVVDPKARAVKAAIDTEGTAHWVALLPDSSKAYATNKQDRRFISVLDLKTNKMVGQTPIPNGTQAAATSPDGKTLLVVDYTAPELVVIDTKTDKVTGRVTLEGSTKGGFRVWYSPDGSKIVAVNHNEDFAHVMDAANMQATQKVFKVGDTPFGAGFAPDGNTLLISNHGDGTVSVIDLAASKVVKTLQVGTGVENLSYY